jgi:hypothetical protein
MRSISPHTEPQKASSQQLTVTQITDPSTNPERPLSMIPVSQRPSALSNKPGSTSRSRANSIASFRRSRRAGSRQSGGVLDQDGNLVVAVPGEEFNFSEFDPNYFDPDDPFFADFDLNVGPMGTSVGWFDPNAHQFQDLGDQLAPGFDGNWQQPLAQPVLTYGDGVIDPQLLSLQATPGLTAVPGANHFMPIPRQQPLVYPDPRVLYHGWPYYPEYNQYGNLETQGNQYGIPLPRSNQYYLPIEQSIIPIQEDITTAPASNKRNQPDPDSEDDGPVVKCRRVVEPWKDDSESEGESDQDKATKHAPARKIIRVRKSYENSRRESRVSGISSSSSLGKPIEPIMPQVGQKPEKCKNKTWIRVNNNTKGETTRTARINEEAKIDLGYKKKLLPHRYWESHRFTYDYYCNSSWKRDDERDNYIDEFKNKKMSPRQVMEYITDYPSDDLRLWLQVSPADNARRYGSEKHSKCLFEDCPKHIYGDNGTIDVGHYRIAFDEKFKRHGNKVVDPYDAVGFVHLDCLERFCDFEKICKVADVQVDTRDNLPRELDRAKWTMAGRVETHQAHHFVKACRKNKLRETENFANYPVHSFSADKDMSHSLVRVLNDLHLSIRTRSQMNQFCSRTITPNAIMIHRGDMDIAMTQKKIKKSKAYRKAIRHKRATTATYDFVAEYDDHNLLINQRIAQCHALKAKFDAEDAGGKKRRTKATQVLKPKPTPKRRYVASNSDSDSERDTLDVDNINTDSDVKNFAPDSSTYVSTRHSPRNPQRLNYAVDNEPHVVAIPAQPQPRHQPEPQPINTTGYAPARKASFGALWPPGTPLDIDDFPVLASPTTRLSAEDVAALTRLLQRRKSSTLSRGPVGSPGRPDSGSGGSMASPARRSPRESMFAGIMKKKKKKRTASFVEQPLSEGRVFGRMDPPNRVVAVDGGEKEVEVSRSVRLSSRGC